MTTPSLIGSGGFIASLARLNQHPGPISASGVSSGERGAELSDIVHASLGVLPSIGDLGMGSSGGPLGHLGTTGLFGTLSPSGTHLVPGEKEPTLPKGDQLGAALDPLHGLRLPGGEANDPGDSERFLGARVIWPCAIDQTANDINHIPEERHPCRPDDPNHTTGWKWLDGVIDWLFGPPMCTPNPDADGDSGTALKFAPPALGWQAAFHKPLDPGDPVDMDSVGPSNVLRGRDQAVDPNPAADEPDDGAARRALLTSGDAVTDPAVESGLLLVGRLPGIR